MVKNKGPHVALLFLKMMKRPVGIGELRALSPKFKKNGKNDQAQIALDRLVELGFAVQVDDKWQVTPQGVREVYELSLRVARKPTR